MKPKKRTSFSNHKKLRERNTPCGRLFCRNQLSEVKEIFLLYLQGLQKSFRTESLKFKLNAFCIFKYFYFVTLICKQPVQKAKGIPTKHAIRGSPSIWKKFFNVLAWIQKLPPYKMTLIKLRI